MNLKTLIKILAVWSITIHDGAAHIAPPFVKNPCPKCPYFLETQENVVAAVGQDVNLTCGVRHLRDKQISWIRKKDLHVLSTNFFTYTSDARMSVTHNEKESPYWVLNIKSVKVADSGDFECQVSTEPKISKTFMLTVVVPYAEIEGTDEVYMKANSDINITCKLNTVTKPNRVTWIHHREPIAIKEGLAPLAELNSGERGGVQLITDKRSGYSTIFVSAVTWRDSGNYTCAPAGAKADTVLVHVLDEGSPAAMHKDSAGIGAEINIVLVGTFLIITFCSLPNFFPLDIFNIGTQTTF